MSERRIPVILIMIMTTVSLIIATVAILFIGCGRREVKKPPDQVSVRLKWLHEVQFAGLYVADQKGFYAKENIEVKLNQGGLEHDEIELVASGQDDFAIVDASQAIVARGEGVPLVMIAVIYRISPTVYFSLQESGIEKPHDFTGRRVAASSRNATLLAMMNKLGLKMEQIEVVPLDHNMEAFFAGEVDVWSGYLTSEVVIAQKQGYKLNIIYPDDYGIHLYNDVIITNEGMIEKNPDLVERFLRATLRGWRYAIENPDEAVTITLKYDENLDESYQRAMMEAQIPLVHTGEDQIGWMRDEILQGMHQMLLEQGVLEEPVDMDKVYTMEFLRKIYGGKER